MNLTARKALEVLNFQSLPVKKKNIFNKECKKMNTLKLNNSD